MHTLISSASSLSRLPASLSGRITWAFSAPARMRLMTLSIAAMRRWRRLRCGSPPESLLALLAVGGVRAGARAVEEALPVPWLSSSLSVSL